MRDWKYSYCQYCQVENIQIASFILLKHSCKEDLSLAYNRISLGNQMHGQERAPIQIEPEISMIQESNPLSNYTDRQIIGCGAYGYVYRCRNQENELVAIKQVPITMDVQGFPSALIRQTSLLKEAKNPNIVALKEVFFTEDEAYLVFEYLQENLKEHIEKQALLNKPLPSSIVKEYLKAMLKGVAHCHKKKIFHRDLKSENILLDSNGSIKIADFGLARTYFVPDHIYTEEVTTLWYRAPQVLLRQPYSTPIDMWSIGCIFAEMLANRIVFRGNTEFQQLDIYLRAFGTPNSIDWPGVDTGKFTQYKGKTIEEIVGRQRVDENEKDLLQRMFKFDPKQRITALQALQHPYFDEP